MQSEPILKLKKKIHFIAIGGHIMHSLAIHLHNLGHQITGSDITIYQPAKYNLEKNGLLPAAQGWFPDKITSELDQIVLGMSAKPNNEQFLKAKQLNLKIYSYPQYIYECSKNKKRIIVAGSHGKTTTTSMILHVLNYHHKSFDYLVGAQLQGFDAMVRISDESSIIIIQGDQYFTSAIEAKSKFEFYHPHLVVFTGIAWDHYNIFPTFQSYVDSFKKLLCGVQKDGIIIYDNTDSNVTKLIKSQNKQSVKFIEYSQHESFIQNQKSYLVLKNGDKVQLQIFGKHNMKNLNGAMLALQQLGITSSQFYDAIRTFKGASKRLQIIGQSQNVKIYRDFAHAPSKAKATIDAVKQQFPNRKIIICYQLASYSSLNKDFLIQYADSLKQANQSLIYFNKRVCEIKNMQVMNENFIKKCFNNESLKVATQKTQISRFFQNTDINTMSVILLMSSSNFDNLDLKQFVDSLLFKAGK